MPVSNKQLAPPPQIFQQCFASETLQLWTLVHKVWFVLDSYLQLCQEQPGQRGRARHQDGQHRPGLDSGITFHNIETPTQRTDLISSTIHIV